MFLLKIQIADSVGLLKAVISKLSKINSGQSQATVSVPEEPAFDEFVSNTPAEESSISIKDILLLLLAYIVKDKNSGAGFDKYLEYLQKELHDAVQGNFSEKLNSPGFIKNLTDNLEKLLEYCESKEDIDSPWKMVASEITEVSGMNPLAQVAKLVDIAMDSKYPPEIRAAAAAMLNDALSHMKNQSASQGLAKNILQILKNSPEAISEVIYPALKDARFMYATAQGKQKPTPSASRFTDNGNMFLNKTLTLA